MKDKYRPIPRGLREAFPPEYDQGIEGPFRRPRLPVWRLTLGVVLVVLALLAGLRAWWLITEIVEEIHVQITLSETEE